MTLIRLDWLPTFEIGVEAIDDAHRQLFAMANGIRAAIAKQDRNSACTSVDAFIVAAERHFATEEKFLADIHYADTEAHKGYHKLLLDKAKRLKRVCDEAMDEGDAEGCYNEVIAFLIDDIVRGDKQFKSYLDQLGLTRVDSSS
jgi:hemerythrin-like metal-binding protein